MAIRLVFLGKLADLAGSEERSLAAPVDWAGLLAAFEPALAEAVGSETTKIAINGALLADKSLLTAKDGDEIAFLPPVSGG